MKDKILYDIRYLNFATDGEILHPHFTITSKHTIRDGFYTEYVKKEFGTRISTYDRRNPFIYAEFEIDTDGKDIGEINKELLLFSSRHLDYVSTFLSFLWLVKDNSISIYSSLAMVPEIEGCVIISNIKSLKYKISGTLESSIFDFSELSLAMRYYEGYATSLGQPSSKNQPIEPKIMLETNEKGELISATEDKASNLKYSSYNCVERGMHFLNVARRERFPAFRIAFYVAVLESIFTTDAANVSHKVAERVAFYLEEEPEERITLYDFIMKVYNVRSTFIHGQKFSEDTLKPEHLLKDAERLDEIIRAVFILITQIDYTIFTDLISNGKSEKNKIEKRITFLKYIMFKP